MVCSGAVGPCARWRNGRHGTRACHYTQTVSRNFLIDEHPDYDNAWLAGGGSAESFKQGPVLGEYIAGRIMGTENDQELNDSFRLLEEELSEDPGGRGRKRLLTRFGVIPRLDRSD
jgi:hypothetical protein